MKKKQHLPLVSNRFMVAVIIIAAMPLLHLWFGQDPPPAGTDGSQTYAFLFVLVAVGTNVAGVYFIVASLIHLIFRHRFRAVFWTDIALGLVAICVVVSMGVFNTYTGDDWRPLNETTTPLQSPLTPPASPAT